MANCLVISNSSGYGGGVINGSVSNCIISYNNSSSSGGGAESCVLNHCFLSNNSAAGFGGGASAGGPGSVLNECVVVGNISTGGKGGGVFGSTLNNCLVVSNTVLPVQGPGNGAGTFNCALNNCTVVGNLASPPPGPAVYSDSTFPGLYPVAKNCIVYYNNSGNLSSPSTNCCTTPLPSGNVSDFTNAPLFVNMSAGDFHLQSNSPCINAGKNFFITTTNDLDSNPRITGGTVDIGAYEYQSPASILSYAWAQKYGLPTDGSADDLDTDGDGMNNWREWKAGTIPTNATSVLQLASPSNSISGLKVTWQSVSGVTYYLQRSTNLPAFSSIQSNLVGQAGATSYTDPTATNGGPFFYRVGVQ